MRAITDLRPPPDTDDTPPYTPMQRRLAAEHHDAHFRSPDAAHAHYRDSGGPMWRWLTGRGT